jgi:prolipoprotein diacylglyceryltransferase
VAFTSAFAHEATGVPLGVRLHPTQLYESVTTLALFAVLLWWFPRKKHDGDVFLGYLGLYAAGRFLIEYLRGDEDRGFVIHHLLSTSQFIALLALAGIAAVFIWRRVDGGGEVRVVSETGEQQAISPVAKALSKGGASPGQRAGGPKRSEKAKRKTQNQKPVS